MVTATVQGAHTARDLEITQIRVARSEWIKLRSLRSTGWALAASAVLTVGTGAVLCAISVAHLHAGKPTSIDPVRLSLFGIYLAQLAVGLVGVLAATGEYATGTIRTTLTAVPRRLAVLWAKIGVVAAAVVVTSEATLLVTFLVCQAVLSGKHASVSLADPGVLRAVAGSGLYLAGVSVLGVAIGFVVRSTAAAAGVMFGVVLVLPEVLGAALPPSLAPDILPYLPSNAGQAIMQTGPVSDTMAPWTGLALFAAYVVVVVVTAALVLRRRDA
jgi:ABC-2 type transport system permease protein